MKLVARIVASVLLVISAAACGTGAARQPFEDPVTRSDFRQRRVKDVAILSPEGLEVTSPTGIKLPEGELRHTMYEYMLREKKYAVPTNVWVDEQIAAGGASTQSLKTDAMLRLTIEQWDASELGTQGAIFAGVSVALEDGQSPPLWSYRCRDLRVDVTPPYGANNTLPNLREAAGRLVEMCLEKLPQSPRLTVDEAEAIGTATEK